MKKSQVLALSAMMLAVLVTGKAQATECGTKDKITIAEFTWLSAGALAHIAHKVLADGYGCSAEVVPGDTVPTATSMLTKNEPDIAPELWISTAEEIWTKAQAKGNLYKAGNIFVEGGQEGWWIPDYVLKDNPGIKSIADLAANSKIFAEAENPDKGRLYGCPPGWACETISANLFKALKLDATFELFSPGSGENLKAVIARKVTKKEPFVGYYWAPTDVIGKYHLVRLDMPAFDAAKFTCLTKQNCVNPEVTGWKSGEVAVVATTSLRDKAPPVAAFLAKFTVPNDAVNKVLAWGDDNKASTEEVATQFLKTEEAIWTTWVPADVADRIKASLK